MLLRRRTRNIPLVLVVDDDRDNLHFIKCILDALNLEYLVSKNGRNALDLAMNKLPNLILLDIMLPEMDGMEVSRSLKQNPLTKNIPIIAVTGLAFPHHRAAIKSAGCDDYICKPFFINELETKLSYFLNFCLVQIGC